jgi:hypothetical protein
MTVFVDTPGVNLPGEPNAVTGRPVPARWPGAK